VSGLTFVSVRVRRAALGWATIVGAEWRLLRRGLTTPAMRRKPGRGSVLPRGGAYPEAGYHRVLCGSVFVGTGPSRVIVFVHRYRPNGIA